VRVGEEDSGGLAVFEDFDSDADVTGLYVKLIENVSVENGGEPPFCKKTRHFGLAQSLTIQ